MSCFGGDGGTDSDRGETDPPCPPAGEDDDEDGGGENENQDEEVRALDRELTEVENRLTSTRGLRGGGVGGLNGRAGYNSVTDALENIQDRLQTLSADAEGGGGAGGSNDVAGPGDDGRLVITTGGGGGSGILSRMCERLNMAQRSHSLRVPLGLLRGSDATLERLRRSSLAGVQMLSHRVRPKREDTDDGDDGGGGREESKDDEAVGGDRTTTSGGGEAGGSEGDSSSTDRRTLFARQRGLSPSCTLVASRVWADRAEAGVEVEPFHDEVPSSIRRGQLSPVGELNRDSLSSTISDCTDRDCGSEEKRARHDDVGGAPREPETPVLLTRRQSAAAASSSIIASLNGSAVDVLSTTDTETTAKLSSSGSVVYSWGSGVQSLHDDQRDRTVAEARLSPTSRLCRPGAAAILSVSTDANLSACATVRGQVFTCGRNVNGCVDPTLTPGKDDETIVVPRPTVLECLGGRTRVLNLSCGLDHAAAVTSHGAVLTWGSNREGQLGHRPPLGDTFDDAPKTFCRPKALLLTEGRRAASVACGHGFTLVLTTRMSVLACGIEEIAGFDTTAGGEATEKPHTLARPVPALEALPLVSVAAGHRHAVVLTAHGTAFAWGVNLSGCCGRPYPERLASPVPMRVPESERHSRTGGDGCPFPNWATSEEDVAGVGGRVDGGGRTISLADDVAVVHVACGGEHTVLVARDGRLLVCGRNDRGQLGLPPGVEEKEAPVVSPCKALSHPSGRRFVAAEAGDAHTVLLDDVGDVWQVGDGTSLGSKGTLTGKNIRKIAAGGSATIAIAEGGSLQRQFSVDLDGPSIAGERRIDSFECLLERVDEDDADDYVSAAGEELARRAEELLKYPAVLNGLFLNPLEWDGLCSKLMSAGNSKVRQVVATAVEEGIRQGLDKSEHGFVRMIHPEQVRYLLLYIRFFDRQCDEDGVNFDRYGTVIASLCEAILALPFEGHKAFLTWATAIHSRELFVRMLVRPLLTQLNLGLGVDVDENGVQHTRNSRKAVPLIIAVLRWFYKASEQAGGIAKPEDFYSDGVSNCPIEALFDDLHRMKQARRTKEVAFFLSSNPFLLSPRTKRDLLQIENEVEMIKTAAQEEGATFNRETGEMSFDPFWKLEIEREHMLEQTLDMIKKTESTKLRKKLAVVFKGEEGIDAGGVTKEFFQLISEELFDISSGMWTDRFGDRITWFNSDCTWDAEGYELTGVLVGLALYNSVLLDVRFPPAVYRKLLGLSLGIEDIVDEELRAGLQQLLDYKDGDVENIFCLNFEVTWMDLGKERKVELKPGGSDISVTDDNREEYVLLYVKWLLVDSIQPQWQAFEKGVMRVMEGSSLNMFRPEELELLVVGTPDLDFGALEANTEYEGGFDDNSDVVRNFWKFVKNADRESQIMFLRFVTGSSMAPIGGLGELTLKIQRAGPDSPQLPTAHTCFNTLLLPDYGDDFEKLNRQLSRAILECEGFGLQ